MSILKKIMKISIIKTIWFNFRVFSLSQAVKLPVIIGRHVKVEGCKKGTIIIDSDIRPAMITFGITGSGDLEYFNSNASYLGIKKTGRLIVRGSAHFATHFSLLISASTMTIGKNFSINNGSVISCCGGGISFGDEFLGGGNITIRDTDGHSIYNIDANMQLVNMKLNTKPIKVGNHVWICNKCDILKGTEIGNNCIVGYGSMCMKPIKGDYVLIGGSPAKVLEENVQWVN